MLALRKSFFRKTKSVIAFCLNSAHTLKFSSLQNSPPHHRDHQHPINTENFIGVKIDPKTKKSLVEERIKTFQTIFKDQQGLIKSTSHREIEIQLKDGRKIKGKSWETTAWDIAKQVNKDAANTFIAVKINYLNRDSGPFITSNF
jgi:hypothetical protein